jgi:DNA-binding CsgD family transcriptional regulator
VWLLALLAAAESDAAGAQRWLRSSFAPDAQSRFPMDVSDDVDLVRIGVAAGDDELVELAAAGSARRAALNPSVASVVAAAAHVRGLVRGDVADLEEAVRLLEQGTRRLELASALEDLGTHLVAVDLLGRALELYAEIGAAWDARRVRSRLRVLGVRRRIVATEQETTGWAALTSAELEVARLVAQGLTNRAVAERLFVSPHTVNTHLRHIFVKLGINSRVELARLAA